MSIGSCEPTPGPKSKPSSTGLNGWLVGSNTLAAAVGAAAGGGNSCVKF